jgi:tetratricopeptide (TPR) repeat protein
MLPAALICASLVGQSSVGAWERYLKDLSQEGEPRSTWILALDPGSPLPVETNEELMSMIADADLRYAQVPLEAWDEIRTDKSWGKGPHWVLLHRNGRIVGDGLGQADPRKILNLLRKEGFISKAERRAAFLKEHPDNGGAWSQELRYGIRLAALRFQAWTGANPFKPELRRDPKALGELRTRLGTEKSARLFPEGLRALRRVSELQGLGWEGIIAFRRVEFLFGEPSLNQGAAEIEPMAWKLLEDADPSGPDPDFTLLPSFWASVARLAGTDIPKRLMGIREVPMGSTDWYFGLRLAWRAVGLENMLRILEQTPSNRLPEYPGSGWEWRRNGIISTLVLRGEALVRAGREEEALAAFQEARRLSGRNWEYVRSLGTSLLGGPAVPIPKALDQLLKADPLPDLPEPPRSAPFRLVALDPSMGKALATLLEDPSFASWNRKELYLESGPDGRARSLQERLGGEEKARWALLSGDQVLASGIESPAARVLASRMESANPSELQRLSDWIGRNPDHLGARKARFKMLLSRMPDPRLESLLAEDALATLLPPHPRPSGWTPDPSLWSWVAAKALPQIERRLESWPTRWQLWIAWIGWTEFHPSSPSALALSERLVLWDPVPSWRGLLPMEVHRAVAPEFRRQRRFEDMRAWFQAAWDLLDRTPLSVELEGIKDPADRPGLVQSRQQMRDGIVLPLRESLVALRRDAELLALDREVAGWMGEAPKGSMR